MEICGHLQPLYGQKNLSGLSLFAVCTPFGPVPMGDFNLEDITFRSKHKLDMSIVSVDPRYVAIVITKTLEDFMKPLFCRKYLHAQLVTRVWVF